MVKYFFAAAFLFVLLGLPLISAVNADTLGIIIEVDSSGKAKITENYRLAFISDFELEDFKQRYNKNSGNLAVWQATYDFFYPHFGPKAGLELAPGASISFDDTSRVLILRYPVEGQFATLLKQEQRSDQFLIENRVMGSFNESGTIVIPENVSIRIILPPNAQINPEDIPAKARLNGNEITLPALRSNTVEIPFSTIKSILPTNNDLIRGVQNIYLLIAAALVLVIVVYAKKDDLEERIEGILVSHSEIKARKQDEDIDFGPN